MASIQKQFEISTKNHKKFKIISEEYSNTFDIVEDCKNRSMTNNAFEDVKKSDDWYWRGVKSYDEALDLLKNGYVDQVEAIKKEISKTVKGQSKRIKFANDIVGYAPIVPLAILGVPNSMINATMKPIKAKVLDIYYDMTAESNYDSEDFINTGIEFLKVITAMEMQGYRINLTAIQSYTDEKIANILQVKLKSANQPLDLKRISFPTMHTAFFRVIGFDWYSKTPKGKHIFGYGHSTQREFARGISRIEKESLNELDELVEFKNELFGKNAVYIPAKLIINTDKNNKQKAIKELIDYECKINNS